MLGQTLDFKLLHSPRESPSALCPDLLKDEISSDPTADVSVGAITLLVTPTLICFD